MHNECIRMRVYEQCIATYAQLHSVVDCRGRACVVERPNRCYRFTLERADGVLLLGAVLIGMVGIFTSSLVVYIEPPRVQHRIVRLDARRCDCSK